MLSHVRLPKPPSSEFSTERGCTLSSTFVLKLLFCVQKLAELRLNCMKKCRFRRSLGLPPP